VAFWGIRWYALAILTGILIAIYVALKDGKKLGVSTDDIYTGLIIGIPVSIIGCRIWYVLFNLSEFDSFADVIGLNGGLSGMAIQGGVIAAIIFMLIFPRMKGVSIYRVLEFVAPGFLIGQILGRWGNFFNQELYGPIVKNTDAFLGWFPKFITEQMYIDGFYRHPVFLYESALNCIVIAIIYLMRRFVKPYKVGDAMGIYLIGYGVVRIFTEKMRGNSGAGEILMWGNIPVSIMISIFFIVGGVAFLIIKRFFGEKHRYQELIKYVQDTKSNTIIFDLDGTLLNTQELITRSFVYTFDHFMKDKVLTDEELESFFGPSLKTTFSRYEEDEEKVDEMLKYYREFNLEQHDNLVKGFPKLVETIKRLHKKKYKLAIVSNKRKDAILQGLELFDIKKYFSVIIGDDDVENEKPNPEGILKALSMIDDPKNPIYVGDTPNDILAAKNANIKSCAVAYSSRIEEMEELEPDFIIKNLYSIFRILSE
ncbi:MAG: pyrophosphatase PpaX, partial [Anaeroplasmataceae bacterium]